MTVLPAALPADLIDIPPPKMVDRKPGVRNQVSDDLVWQRQMAGQWCWAACTLLIMQALGIWKTPNDLRWSQCRVFVKHSGWTPERVCRPQGGPLLGTSCLTRNCVDVDAGGIDGMVSEALAKIVPLWKARPKRIDNADNFSDARIRTLIDRGWPVAVLNDVINSKGEKRRHYVLIIGYDVPAGNFGVWDPAPNVGYRVVDRRHWHVIGDWVGAVDLLRIYEI